MAEAAEPEDASFWITDRTPTADDANYAEEVLVFLGDDGVVSKPFHIVEEGTVWAQFYNIPQPY